MSVQVARRYADRQAWGEVIRALETIPPGERDYAAHHLLGQALVKTGRWIEARDALRTAIRDRPESAVDHQLLGDVQRRCGQHALAIEAYRQALSLGLDDADVRFGLAAAYAGLGQHTGRIADRSAPGRRAGELDGDCYLIGAIPNQAGRFFAAPAESAIYQLTKAFKAGLDRPEAHLLLGDIWLASSRPARALTAYAAIEDRVPADRQAEYYYNYAQACLGVDARTKYLAYLKLAVGLDAKTYGPRLVEAYRQVADRCSAEGDLEGYIHYLGQAVERAPDSVDLHYRLGNALFEADQPQLAAREWQITLELQANHPDRSRLLGLIEVIAAFPPDTADEP